MKYVLVSIIAYLMGNIATAYLVSRAFGKIDIREHGSGNSGSTNVYRVLGAKPAVIVFLGDVLKGAANYNNTETVGIHNLQFDSVVSGHIQT